MVSTQQACFTGSAPGKVILCGEYSVLEAHPALVVAVNRRVEVRLSERNGQGLHISAQGLPCAPQKFIYDMDAQAYRLNEVDDTSNNKQEKKTSPFDFVITLLNALIRQHKLEAEFTTRAWDLVCDSSALFDGPQKLGLGSSAALCTALAGALYRAAAINSDNKINSDNNESLWHTLQNLHSIAQGKRGSGTDLCASIAGGVQQFTNDRDTHIAMTPLALPQGLQLAFIWTGQSASTPKLLGALSDWRARHQDTYSSTMQALGSAASAVCQARDSDTFIRELKAFTQTLFGFDQASQLGIFSKVHAALFEHAKTQPNLVYKPCGAGGGDLGVAIGDNIDTLNTFVEQLPQYSATRVLLEIDAQGLISERHE